MRYAQIRSQDVQNGPSIRVSLFVQGCDFHCKGCFNESTWDFEGGKEFTVATFNKIIEFCKPDYIAGLSVLGGEPLNPKNIKTVIEICKKFKEIYPNKSIWLWTGYELKNIVDKNILNYIDVIVTGQYMDYLKDFKLRYKGSSNQRVNYLKNGSVLYYE